MAKYWGIIALLLAAAGRVGAVAPVDPAELRTRVAELRRLGGSIAPGRQMNSSGFVLAVVA